MYRKSFFMLMFLFLAQSLWGQKVETIYLDLNNKSSNLYLLVHPSKLPYSGFMFLIPGMGETPQGVLTQTNLAFEAANRGILTIIPTFKTGTLSFGVDRATQDFFKEILHHVVSSYGLADKPLFVGGFSIGGSCAIKFAELAVAENYPHQPTAVFAIDPPLDFERFYNSSKRTLRLAKDGQPKQEALYMIGRIEKEMGGTPASAPENFHKISPYSYSDTTQQAIRPLVNIPITIFTEPDVHWWASERGYDYSAMNAYDGAAMINELRLLGNDQARLITTENKGYRKPDNRRHPHSWSIAEPKELVSWLLSKNRSAVK